MSARAVVNLMNGLFGADYPLDSTVTYNWTEFEDERLKKNSQQDLEQLQNYILNDIISCINKNLKLGTITMEDALKLKRYLHKLCDYLGSVHKELKGMKDMTDESFMTDVDILCEEHEKAMAERDRKLAEQHNRLLASAKAILCKGMEAEEIHDITKLPLEVIAAMRD